MKALFVVFVMIHPPNTFAATSYCGASWADAATTCGVPCPDGNSTVCPSNRERCFSGITSCNTAPSVSNRMYCGATWEDAASTCDIPCSNGNSTVCPNHRERCFAEIMCRRNEPIAAPSNNSPSVVYLTTQPTPVRTNSASFAKGHIEPATDPTRSTSNISADNRAVPTSSPISESIPKTSHPPASSPTVRPTPRTTPLHALTTSSWSTQRPTRWPTVEFTIKRASSRMPTSTPNLTLKLKATATPRLSTHPTPKATPSHTLSTTSWPTPSSMHWLVSERPVDASLSPTPWPTLKPTLQRTTNPTTFPTRGKAVKISSRLTIEPTPRSTPRPTGDLTGVPATSTTSHYFCGASWVDTHTNCYAACPHGNDSECDDAFPGLGYKCFADTGCSVVTRGEPHPASPQTAANGATTTKAAATSTSIAAVTKFASRVGTVIENVLERKKDVMNENIFLRETPEGRWEPSSVYRFNDFIAGLRIMYQEGVADKHFYMGPSDGRASAHVYGLVNIAAFLAQCMKETIQFDACDENSWDLVNGKYPLSNSCGQLGQSYQDYHCSEAEAHMECPIDPNMEIMAVTNAKWYGAPGPLKCGPKARYEFTGYWDYDYDCNKWWENPPEYCTVYDGQRAGAENNELPVANIAGRTDVEGCCWWGRGAIQITGPCNVGKLNYYLGKGAVDDNRHSRYPTIDFCKDPEAICASEDFKELKWIAGMFYWVEILQSYNMNGWDYISKLHEFVDGGMTDISFINEVSGIVNRGCHDPPCEAGAVHGEYERRMNFQKVLSALDLLQPP